MTDLPVPADAPVDAATEIAVVSAEQLLAVGRQKRLTVATAESCTGGLIAGAITEIAGSSDIFDRGFVTYSNAAKQQMLGVTRASLEAFGAVSEPVAREMAEGALARSDADIAVSVTGIAGPGGSENKPEGRVCFGLARRGHVTVTKTVEFGARGRVAVRQFTVNHALDLLLGAMQDAPPPRDRLPLSDHSRPNR
ncbi:CinA family protein [Tropicimonas sp. IMCC34043]|uniref:CinA family protein n=1 Tax=Tropicimonas sp. IMCC34043 TaxID=2248760 RepID=UPI000E276AA7|nr:CinA family protein [Tropicimonas sp. IMCC34043]